MQKKCAQARDPLEPIRWLGPSSRRGPLGVWDARVLHNLSVAPASLHNRFSVYPQLWQGLQGWQSVPDVCLYPVGALPVDWTTDEDVCGFRMTSVRT